MNDSGTGSLRWALEDLDGPRIVVFEVGGQIDLKDEIQINGDVTLAGQTAPGGITVTGARLRVVESNVIIRGMNVRPGDSDDGHDPDNRDGISVGKRGNVVENVIIDSNSISWAIDENTATWGAPSNVTWSNNIIAEGLVNSSHSKGDHSMGMLIGDGSTNISIIGNLLASNDQRNAIVKDASENIEFINNVVYNYGRQGLEVYGGSLHAIGNVMISGEDSNGRAAIRFNTGSGDNAFYISNNISEIGGNATGKIKSGLVFDAATEEVLPTSEVLDWVLSHAGVMIGGERSKIDARIIDTVLKDIGTLIDAPKDVGGYLDRVTSLVLRDSDDDGIPDVHEVLLGSDVTKADAQADADGNGIANIEDYINGLLDGSGAAPTVSVDVSYSPEESTEDTGVGEQTQSASGNSTGSAAAFSIEAEDFDLSGGFSTASLGHASGRRVIRSLDEGTATTTFDGESGTYDMRIDYFDENDGVSYLEVRLNDEVLDAWYWDQNLGSAYADAKTLTYRMIKDVDIEAGDEIIFYGSGDRGSEPLRIDTLAFTPSDAVFA
ncbi:hypothetical protein [Salipiger sp. PrR002]|uniref:hypothetical protein n=1 Tax=Salipiger sp. PrR002 TaxID=2706489 RepID=UPI0013B80ECD|nr:hypothetical protein [Salipiger sp. PrR002]NDW00156.1 hypothetical protein [Salipiger sp. PrR002]NDW56835.1 hypothetical protein [Salipiger sp. PrR004]